MFGDTSSVTTVSHTFLFADCRKKNQMIIITNNPYRILGVYTNSPKKDIVAHKGKATAFLKVNKSVEYPLDLKGILPPLSRTLEMMNEAEAHFAIAREQICSVLVYQNNTY